MSLAVFRDKSPAADEREALTPAKAAEIMEAVMIRGDLSKLNPDERSKYCIRVCESLGLNPMTKPFEYLELNGRLVLYARKDCTDQLRSLHKISVTELSETERDGVLIVTAKVCNPLGRVDVAKGAVTIKGLTSEALANAIMKAESKAKRRATLSICGLGFLDETEIEDMLAEPKAPRILKKDTRALYHMLQNALDTASGSVENLKTWREAAAEQIETLPRDWQESLYYCYQAKLDDPAMSCGDILTLRASLPKAAHATAHDVDGVVWDEDEERPATAEDRTSVDELPAHSAKPAADPLDIPPAFDRRVSRRTKPNGTAPNWGGMVLTG